MKKNRNYPLFGALAKAVAMLVFLFLLPGAVNSPLLPGKPAEGLIEKSFSLDALGRETIEFTADNTGAIRAFAEWSPAEAELSLILFRPGQMNFIERVDSGSPAELVFEATEGDIAKGSDWKLKVVNGGTGKVTGHIRLTYPVQADSLLQ
ncbi:MAG: hypothetical protein H6564_22595 [Lewinellaceae bacterium]|nr:hypothetical protein [Lewinellaceae bacterium]